MKVSILGNVLLGIICFSSPGHSTEESTFSPQKSIKYKKLETDDSITAPAVKGSLAKKKSKQKKTPSSKDILLEHEPLQYIVFPEKSEKLATLISDGPSVLSIYISKDKYSLERSLFADNPDALEKLEDLTVFHYITKDCSYDEQKVRDLLPLIKAPNLRKITLTHFLAEALLPLLREGTEITLDFLPRHITDPILPPYFIKGYRARALEWQQTYPNHKIYIPEITSISVTNPVPKS